MTRQNGWRIAVTALGLVPILGGSLHAQSSGALQGRVFDASGAVIPGATVTVRRLATGFDRATSADAEGRYYVASIPAGTYRVLAVATGFRSELIEELAIEVGRTVLRDFRLEVSSRETTIVVRAERPLIDRATMSVGTVVTAEAIRDTPLNGRHFVDLALFVPGSVTPPQSGQFAPPTRGQGSFAFNSSGGREDAVNVMVNGININNQSFGLIVFHPNLDSMQEFKIDNASFSAEFGRSSGAIVNMVTRSGTNVLHGQAFEFVRNEALDARNAFNVVSANPSPFKRHQFGGHVGGPIVRNAAFFFGSYERLRQRQGLDVNTVVLSDAQRAAITSPAIRAVAAHIPRPNHVDETGTSRWLGYTAAPVDSEQWSADVSYASGFGRLHGYVGIQDDTRGEPTLTGNTLPGFGDTRLSRRRLVTINHARPIGSRGFNEVRLGLMRFSIDGTPNVALNPATLGIRNGIDRAIGLPQFNVAGAFNFGGPAAFPQGRKDTTVTVSDTATWILGDHSLKLGGEFRRVANDNYNQETGQFNFPTVAAFLAGTANSFAITLGERASRIRYGAVAAFAQDSFRWRPNLTFELGLRYEWNMSPTERDNRFVVFDAATASLQRVGVDVAEIYAQNHNVEPRLGLIWNASADGRTVVRGAYALQADQPLGNAVFGATANPPFARPLVVTGSVPIESAIDLAGAAGLAVQTVDPHYRNPRVNAFNVNIQRQLTTRTAAMIGYFGSRGSHMRLSRNINQPIGGVRPYTALSPSSPILPGTPVGNIIQVEGTGESTYDALWVTARHGPAGAWQLTASYTWSKSLDFNSLSSAPAVVLQDSYDARNNRGLSDFDARHRFVIGGIYRVPFRGAGIIEGWNLAATAQVQSGNPINLVTSSSTINGVVNTVRPDVTGPIRVTGSTSQWFDTSVFQAGTTFGNLGRNVIIGPGFGNVDLAVWKDTRLGSLGRLQLRAEVFNLLNRVNLGQPGRVLGTVSFGRITNTRFPAGDAGSARQMQLAIKFGF